MITTKIRPFILLFLAVVSVQLAAQPSSDAGRTLFRNYCATCHAKDMKTDLTGPALGGTEERWSEFPREDLYEWIRNSQASIASGQPRAVELWEEWKPTVMTAWPNLTDEDIESILLYVNDVYTGAGDAAASAATTTAAQTDEAEDFNWLYFILFGLLGVLAIILARIITSLNTIIDSHEGRPVVQQSVIQQIFTKRVITFLIFGLVVFGGFTTVNNAINLGRQQGYAPDQPIQFSHATHAGENQIDCQYCHDGARRSKHCQYVHELSFCHQ
jgi:mono/diheme cytochrome c family protein